MAFRCPICHAISSNPNDERERYCVQCAYEYTLVVSVGQDAYEFHEWLTERRRNDQTFHGTTYQHAKLQ
jgi:hypothetical protein